jgi:hypothetical protein
MARRGAALLHVARTVRRAAPRRRNTRRRPPTCRPSPKVFHRPRKRVTSRCLGAQSPRRLQPKASTLSLASRRRTKAQGSASSRSGSRRRSDALKQSIGVRSALRDQVQLVTLSFDPARDTPAVMQRYAGSRVKEDGSGVRWYFLTTRSARELMPLVEGFGQDVRWTVDRSSGQPRRELSHVLKVFLIDRAGFVREIYSSTFLHPQTVVNDIETLRLER